MSEQPKTQLELCKDLKISRAIYFTIAKLEQPYYLD